MSISTRIFFFLVIATSLLIGLGAFIPTAGIFRFIEVGSASVFELAALNTIAAFVLLGGLGYLGVKCADELSYPKIWDVRISNSKRFLLPILGGASAGVLMLIFYKVLDPPVLKLYESIHPNVSLVHLLLSTLVIVITMETLRILFLITLLVDLISVLFLKRRYEYVIFLIVASVVAVAIPVVFSFGFSVFSRDWFAMRIPETVIILLGAVCLRYSGFLATLSISFAFEVVCRVGFYFF